VITYSDIMSYLQCRRRFSWGFQHDLTAPEVVYGDLPLGSRVHKALEHFHASGLDPIKTHDALGREDLRILEDTDPPGWQLDRLYQDIIVGRNCVTAYAEWYYTTNPDAGMDTVGVEMVVETPFLNGTVLLRGRVDHLKQRLSDGSLVLDDWKTTSVWRAGQRERLERGLQHHVYGHAIRQMFPDKVLSEASYTIIKKVANRKWVKSAIIERITVPALERTAPIKLAQLEEIVREIVRMMERSEELGSVAAFPTVQDACRWCPFRHPCELMDENPLSAIAMLDAEFEQGKKHARYRTRELQHVVV